MSKQRTPRPKYLSMIKDREEKVKYLLRDWIVNGMKLLGFPLSIPELSKLTGIQLPRIVEELSVVSGVGKVFSEGDNGFLETSRAVSELAIFWGLEDKALAQRQAANLLHNQGDGYVPYLSSEVNRAIKNSLDATANILKLHTTLFSPEALKEARNQAAATNEKGFLYVEDMVNLIQENKNQSPLQNTEVLNALRATYLQPGSVPNVIAIQQDDFKPEDLGASKELPSPDGPLIEHDERREHLEDLNTEAY